MAFSAFPMANTQQIMEPGHAKGATVAVGAFDVVPGQVISLSRPSHFARAKLPLLPLPSRLRISG